MARRMFSRSWQSAKTQQADLAREFHYLRVQEIALDQVSKNQRSKRFDVVVRLGLRKGGVLKTQDGGELAIARITPEGMIVLENLDEIDPLKLE